MKPKAVFIGTEKAISDAYSAGTKAALMQDLAFLPAYYTEDLKTGDGSLSWIVKTGNRPLSSFSTISHFYCFTHPGITLTTYYKDAFGLYLDAVGDTYDGPEVRDLIECIIKENLLISPKTKRIKTVKQIIKDMFHVEGTNYPRWIQGAEWPMGKDTPMQFIKKVRKGEEVHFYFEDVSTGETKTIVQFY